MSQYVYVLQSLIDWYKYVGMTKNLENRLKQHNDWVAKATKWHKPYKVIYTECFETYKEAYHREKYFKTGKWREKLKLLTN